jgi:putative endonuclease
MYYLYIIQNNINQSYYIGHTRNIGERVKRHNEGRSKYTAQKGSWRMIYQEIFQTRGEAMKREKEIKEKKSKKYIEYLIRTSRQ